MAKLKKVGLAIDTDIIAFKASTVNQKRSIIVTHKKTGWKKKFKTRTDFWGSKRSRDEGWIGKQNTIREGSGKPKLSWEDFEVVDKVVSPPVSNSCQVSKQMLTNLQKVGKLKKMLLPMGGKDNFRDDIATVRQYKGNRKDLVKPENLEQVKAFLNKHKDGYTVEGHETDDELSILGQKGWVQCTTDKDAMQCNGTYVWNFDKTDNIFYIPKKGSGKIWVDDKKKVRAYGLKSFILQALTQDTVDNIYPKTYTDYSYGEMSVYKDLDPITKVKDCIEYLVKMYKEFYPEPFQYKHWDTEEELTGTWETMLQEMGSLLWMKRHKDDQFSLDRLYECYKD